ncbi:MAG: DUF4419 domain-containing protein [Bacteroidaceae bacterium]|nr:DUF4419 domain-containing protein [Bacteroidaceae bacterium]
MKTNSITLWAILCLCISTISYGQVPSDPPTVRAYTLPLPLNTNPIGERFDIDVNGIADSILRDEARKLEKNSVPATEKKSKKKEKKVSKQSSKVLKQSSKVLKQTKTGITFVVDEDLSAPKQTFTMLSSKELSSRIISKRQIPQPDHNVVKTSFDGESLCYLGEDNFFKCVVHAFADHRSLVLSPDMVWLLIGQGFSRYVNAHSEELRDKLVSHQGKMVLRVEKNNDVLDPSKGDWAQLLNDFSACVAENTKGDVADMMTANFSTTGMDERIASQITLMETVKTYFDFWNVVIACGIPTITLEGTPEDWQKVREKARMLAQYGLEKWSNDLDPILAEFVKASEGKPNQAFWENMVMKYRVEKFKSKKVCGLYDLNETTQLDGWFLTFFPNENGITPSYVLHTDDMPSEMARGNFTQEYIDPVTGESLAQIPVQLWAGFVGVQVDEKTGAFTPKIGWFARIGDEEQEKLSRLYQIERHGGLSYSYRKETDTLPGILAKMTSISKLTLRFYQFPVNIPAWVDNMKIGKLEISGSLSEAEEAQLRQRFPEVSITNYKKWETKKEDATKEQSGSIKTIDISEFESLALFDPYDIRQVLE